MSNMGTTKNPNIHEIKNLQRKSVRIINFKSKYVALKPLFIDSKEMTYPDIIKSENYLLVL